VTVTTGGGSSGGIVILLPHFGHLPILPAAESGARKLRSHLAHWTAIGMLAIVSEPAADFKNI